MTKQRKGQRYDYYRPFKDADLFYDFTTTKGEELRFTARQFIEALESAADEMSYSNYHTDKFMRIEEIVRRYCSEHGIPLGQSEKQRNYHERRKAEKRKRIFASLPRDPVKALAIISKLEF